MRLGLGHMLGKAATVVLVALCAFAAFGLSGCVFSDAITEVIYIQDDQYDIDYNAPKKYRNTPTAQLKSDQLPRLDAVDAGSSDANDIEDAQADQLENQVNDIPPEDIIQEDPPENATQEGDESSDSDNAGNDASGTESNGEDDDKSSSADGADTSEGANGQENRDSSANGSNGDTTASDRDGSGNATDKGDSGDGEFSDIPDGDTGTSDGGGDEGDWSDTDATNSGDGEEGSEDGSGGNSSSDESGKSDTDPGKAFYEDGAYDDLPENVHSVAAVGNAAIVAAALGGADGTQNLVAADSNLLGSQAQNVLSSRGIGSVSALWNGDGTDAGSVHLQDLISLKPDAVLVTEGEDTLTAEEESALEAQDIKVVAMPSMTSVNKTRNCVLRIGALLGKGGDSAAADLAVEYDAFQENVRAKCDGYDTAFALYVSEWRSSAYHGSLASTLAITGAAFAPGGKATTVLNDFLELAHVVNTPSVNANYSAIKASSIVWPIAGGTTDSDWDGLTRVNGVQRHTGTSGYDYALTRYTQNATNYDMGSPSYRAFICKTADVRDRIIADRDAGGLYSAGNARTSIESNDYDVLLNPCGLFSSWTDGSMESILETAWAYKVFRSDDGFFESQLSDFYDRFYGYSLTDYSDILDARFAE